MSQTDVWPTCTPEKRIRFNDHERGIRRLGFWPMWGDGPKGIQLGIAVDGGDFIALWLPLGDAQNFRAALEWAIEATEAERSS